MKRNLTRGVRALISRDLYNSIHAKLEKEIPSEQLRSYEELTGLWDEYIAIIEDKYKEARYDADYVTLSHLNTVRFGILALSLNENNDECEGLQQIRFIFNLLFTFISNSALAITKLALDGLDYQAYTLLRNLDELCYTLLNIMIDSDKRIALYDSGKNENGYEIWRKFFSMKKLNETVNGYLGKINKGGEESYVYTWWIERYGNLSSFVHKCRKTLET